MLKTPKEVARENKREITRARRELQRETNRLQNTQKQQENEIRKLAAKGEKTALRQYAKNIVKTRNQVNKISQMDATLSALESEIATITTNQTMMDVMVKTTRTLERINRMIPLQGFQQTMMNFEKNKDINEAKQQMMEDVMDSAFDGEADEEETDQLVDQVLGELNINIASQMPSVTGGPLAAGGARAAAKPQAVSTADADLEARLEALRRN
ncbi:unnamed protein product [Didymodactylos carnosus]|uniref:Uncharacterized protein n=1 Tax=Didymodactylos carnosus TaxID=1234261 RepID=A0A814VKS8_9BILA|nr:unnamed protein product [Didymodactylos carnosus]CAF3952691.1 unnamed protein product [Didymodactylos carnosus]